MKKKKRRNRNKSKSISLIICAMLLSATVSIYLLGKPKIQKEDNEFDADQINQNHQEQNNDGEVIQIQPQTIEVKKEKSYIVEEGEKVDLNYFDDAVFVGNSRTQGLMLYGGINNAKFYADKGLVINKIEDKPITIMGEQNKDTVINALIRNKFNKYYIMLGTNELGWAYENIFVADYQELIDKIKQINPDGIIYIQSILPVSKAKSDNDKIYNNANIENYNNLLKRLARENNVHYLDVAYQFKDESGSLDPDASSDGIHLKAEYCKLWTEYLLTHTIKSDDYKNQGGVIEKSKNTGIGVM